MRKRAFGLGVALLVMAGMAVQLPALRAEHGIPDLASDNMVRTANRPRPSGTNTDMAFWSGSIRGRHYDLAAAGNYSGFRLFDVADRDNPLLLTDFPCRGPQGDVSFYRAADRLLLVTSVDRPQTTAGCPSADTPIITGVPSCEATPQFPVPDCPAGSRSLASPGFEGLRIFDVSDPEAPVQLASVPTACGSHSHTTVQDDQRAIVYVSSYPVGSSPTPAGAVFGGPRCTIPHARISIVEIPDADPASASVLKEQFLHGDTQPFLGSASSGGTGAVGCHDITVYWRGGTQRPLPAQAKVPSAHRRVAAAACLEEGQIWDVSDVENPSTLGSHTHIRNPYITSGIPGDLKGLFSTASFTWDGEVLVFSDEYGGGGEHGCDGAHDTRGNLWFYRNVAPGTANAPLYGRYQIPRPQPAQEVCTLHYGNIIPTGDGYFGVAGGYESGTTVFDFTGVRANPEIFLNAPAPGSHGDPSPAPPLVANEIAFYDSRSADHRGRDDVWASYWYNDRIFVNGGLGRPLNPGGRGLDVYKLLARNGRLVDSAGDPTVTDPTATGTAPYRARKATYLNPQTQETVNGTGPR